MSAAPGRTTHSELARFIRETADIIDETNPGHGLSGTRAAAIRDAADALVARDREVERLTVIIRESGDRDLRRKLGEKHG